MRCRECKSDEGSFWKYHGLCEKCHYKQLNNHIKEWLSKNKNKTLFDFKKELKNIEVKVINYNSVSQIDYTHYGLAHYLNKLSDDEIKKLEKKLRLELEVDKLKQFEQDRELREEAEKVVYGKVKTTRVSLTEEDKEIIFKKFNNQCSICGKTEGLHIHHKNKDATDNRISNLIVLCGVCHKKIHMKVR